MNSYKKLINNSIIFAVGTLGSKVVSFLLVPLYTYYLSTVEYGTVDLVITTVNMLIPIVSVSAYEAVLRFTMDKNEEPDVILSNSLLIALGGFLIAILFYPVLNYFGVLNGNLIYLYLILIAQMVERILAQYTRALGKIKLFAANGILLTFSTGILNIIFLVFLNLGVLGYYWALILSYTISATFLLIASRAYSDFRVSNINKPKLKVLLDYALPLIPNSLMWWLINASSRYFITWFISVGTNGLFAVASRIPSLLNIVYQVFNQAWQLSAIEEYESNNKSTFYSNIFEILYVLMFLATSAMILIVKPMFSYLFASDYYTAWRIVPYLLLGAVFSSFSSYLGSNYVAAKQTKGVFKTSVYGGIISLLFNITLIPTLGIVGAGLSSMISFYVTFLIRYHDTQQFIQMAIDWKKFYINIGLIFAQVALLYSGIGIYLELVIGIILLLAQLFINQKPILTILKMFLKK